MEVKKGSKRKKRRNQMPIGVILLVLIVIAGIIFSQSSKMLAVYWIFGIAFGFVLQKSRFCFTASLRDPVLTGSTSLSRAVLVAFAVATIGFAAIQFSSHLKGDPIPGNISPVGLHTVIGATMFGIGMVIAGGCASGTLMRVGEGFMQQWIAIVFFVIGSLWGAKDFVWWTENVINKLSISDGVSKGVFLPNVFGWGVAFFGQLILLGALFLVAEWFEFKKLNPASKDIDQSAQNIKTGV
jgi:uncharacterized protein